jgi:quercetin dioxygenase-like cupin family protein
MSARNDLPQFVLDALGDEAEQLTPEDAKDLAEAFTCVAEIGAGADGAAPEPSAAGRARLMADIAKQERFSPFLDRVAAFFDLGADAVKKLLASVPGKDAWEAFPVPGVELMHVDGGPRVATVDVGFVRIAPGTSFPRHRHVGVEEGVVIQGAYTEEDGSVVTAGDTFSNPDGTTHGFQVTSDVPMIFAVVVPGVEIEGVDYQSPGSENEGGENGSDENENENENENED